MPEDDDIFAGLGEKRLTWAVASIYGESERLAGLHMRLARRLQPGDNLVYLGNFLGRGPDIIGTVQQLLLFRRAQMARQLDGNAGAIVFLRGSQEEMWHKLLQVHFAPNPRQVIEWMLTQGVGATLRAYGSDAAEARTAANGGAVVLSRWTNQLRARMRALDGHEKLMTVLRRAAFTADHAVLFVNAGLDPALPLAQQRDAFWWRGGDFDRIDRPYNSFQRVVRGADPWHRGLVVNDHTTSIDAGCGFGGPLVAACFDPEGNVAEILEA